MNIRNIQRMYSNNDANKLIKQLILVLIEFR
jgi:hypothetical protein